VRSAVVGQADSGRTAKDTKTQAPRVLREKSKHRPPPASGIPSKTRIMISNLPYDLTEEKVSDLLRMDIILTLCLHACNS
jgi:hypothetical protein